MTLIERLILTFVPHIAQVCNLCVNSIARFDLQFPQVECTKQGFAYKIRLIQALAREILLGLLFFVKISCTLRMVENHL